MSQLPLQPGDWVIFRATKFSQRPGRRATNVNPAQQGDTYSYTVDKFWIVESVSDDGIATLRTRRGKRHEIPANDRRLRKPSWWERWLHKDRFRAISDSPFNQKLSGESPAATARQMVPRS